MHSHRCFSCHALCKAVIEPVFYPGHVVVCAVGVDGVEVVVDGDIPHPVLGEGEVDIQPGQRGVAAQPRQVFGDTHGHPPRLDFLQHLLKAGAVIVGAAVPVVYKADRVWKTVFLCVL